MPIIFFSVAADFRLLVSAAALFAGQEVAGRNAPPEQGRPKRNEPRPG